MSGRADPWAAPVRGLLLDVDDTLIDTRGGMAHALRAAAAATWPAASEQQATDFATHFYADPGGYFDAYTRGELSFALMRQSRYVDAAVALGLDVPSSDPAAQAQFTDFEAVYRTDFMAAQFLFPDVRALLGRAAQAGVAVGLLTNSGSAVTRDKVTAAGLADLLATTVTTDTLGVGKPDPRVFEQACLLIGVVPKEVVCVGDTLGTDVQGARRAGLRVAWLQRRELPEPRDAGWDVAVDDPAVRIVGGLDEVRALLP